MILLDNVVPELEPFQMSVGAQSPDAIGFDMIALLPVPLSPLFLLGSTGYCAMYTFFPLGIGRNPSGVFHPCGVMYIAFFSISLLSSALFHVPYLYSLYLILHILYCLLGISPFFCFFLVYC